MIYHTICLKKNHRRTRDLIKKLSFELYSDIELVEIKNGLKENGLNYDTYISEGTLLQNLRDVHVCYWTVGRLTGLNKILMGTWAVFHHGPSLLLSFTIALFNIVFNIGIHVCKRQQKHFYDTKKRNTENSMPTWSCLNTGHPR